MGSVNLRDCCERVGWARDPVIVAANQPYRKQPPGKRITMNGRLTQRPELFMASSMLPGGSRELDALREGSAGDTDRNPLLQAF